MFKLIKVSMEGLVVLTVLGFLFVWVILQEYGTLLIWAAIIFGLVKLVKYISQTKVVRYTYVPPKARAYPRPGVSEPVALDRYSLLNKPLDVDPE